MGAAVPGPEHDLDAEVFETIYPALRRFAAVVGSNADDPDDLVQEAVTRVLARVPLVELGNPVAYLRRAIANLVIDNARAFEVRRRSDGRLAQPLVSVDHYPSDLSDLDRIPAMDRAVLYLVDVEGMPFSDVAATLDVTPVAARLRASRARRRIRAALEEEQ